MDFTESNEFSEILNSESELLFVVRSHQLMDNFLSDLIEEQLVEKHHLELRRIPCAVRIELAHAMGLLHSADRGAYLQMNALRNRFAHEPGTRITEKDALDLYNGIGDRLRTIFKVDFSSFNTPDAFIRHVMAIIAIVLEDTLKKLKDGKLWDLALMQEIVAVSRREPHDGTDARTRILKRFEELRKSRSGTVSRHKEALIADPNADKPGPLAKFDLTFSKPEQA